MSSDYVMQFPTFVELGARNLAFCVAGLIMVEKKPGFLSVGVSFNVKRGRCYFNNMPQMETKDVFSTSAGH